jgi:hypothetical protein
MKKYFIKKFEILFFFLRGLQTNLTTITMKNKKILISLFVLACFFALGQNPIWITPPNYVNPQQTQIFSLPINPDPNENYFLDPFDYYDGQQAKHCSNGISDLDGNLNFFVIDGLIYDSDGSYIAYAWSSVPPNVVINEDFTDYQVFGNGGTETVIVPHPTNCDQFYFFYADVEEGTRLDSRPMYLLYDHCSKSILRRGPWYSNQDTDNNTNNIDELFNSTTIFPESGDDQFNGMEWGVDVNAGSGLLSLAASDQQPDGSRFVVCRMTKRIVIIKIYPNGNLGYWKRYQMPYFSINPTMNRSELELVQNSTTGEFILAFSNETSEFNDAYMVQIMKISPDFLNVLEPADFVIFPRDNNGISSPVHGLEFSPDHSKLYISITPNAVTQEELYVVDLTEPPTASPLGLSTTLPFEYSHLEVGADGNLYIATNQGLYTLSDPNNPDPNNISLSPTIPFNYQENYSAFDPFFQNIHTRSFTLPDQIDGMNYADMFNNDLSCCLKNRTYTFDKFETSQQGNTWQPGVSTVFSSILPQTIFIKDELRVKAGTTLTLNNLTLKFSPEARLVVENGDGTLEGGKLILNQTRLTVDDRCDPGKLLWYGVEVWGNANQAQGTFITSNQGGMEMRNNSRIENAWMGVLVGKRTSELIEECPDVFNEDIDPFLFDDSRTGGIVRILPGSSLVNNQRGLRFRPYQNNGLNNVSIINDADFEWNDNTVASQYSVQAHVQLEGVKGITIRGCRFNNGTSDFTSPTFQGIGILSRASQFTVTDYCNSFIPPFAPCQNPIKTVFSNLSFGVHASNPLDNFTFLVEKSEFDNCARGVYAIATRNERIIRNVFKIRQATYQTVGIYLERSTGYTVQENDLGGKVTDLELNDVRSYGIVADNSGIQNNLIYKNRIGWPVDNAPNKLHVGTYAIKLNGSSVPASVWQNGMPSTSTGLQYRCNQFIKDIYLSDIAVNGIINYSQGNPKQAIAAANSFETPNYGMPEHDITMDLSSQGIRYFIQNGPVSHVPVYYTSPNYHVHLLGVNSQYNANKTCASLLGKPLNVVIGDYQNSLALTNSFKDKMKGGDIAAQLLAIELNPGSNATRNLLIQYSPFLTDEVLVSYLNSSASSGMKKDVLTANTSLSEVVMQAVVNSNLPQGTKNQIITAQNTTNQKEETIELYNYHHFEMDRNFNEALSRLLLDTAQSMNYSEVIAFLNQSNDRNSKKILVDIHLSKGDLAEMELVKASLATDEDLELDYFLLQDLKEQVRQYASIEDAMEETSISNPIESLAQNSTDVYIKGKSIAFLESKIGPKDIDELPPVQSSGMMIQQNNEVQSIYEILQVVSIYPNPSTGQVYFDYPDHEEGVLSIQLLDLSGKLVYSYDSQSESNGERVDLSAVKKGMYMARISIDGVYIETQKLLLK